MRAQLLERQNTLLLCAKSVRMADGDNLHRERIFKY
jgi:hypothetical protein